MTRHPLSLHANLVTLTANTAFLSLATRLEEALPDVVYGTECMLDVVFPP